MVGFLFCTQAACCRALWPGWSPFSPQFGRCTITVGREACLNSHDVNRINTERRTSLFFNVSWAGLESGGSHCAEDDGEENLGYNSCWARRDCSWPHTGWFSLISSQPTPQPCLTLVSSHGNISPNETSRHLRPFVSLNSTAFTPFVFPTLK